MTRWFSKLCLERCLRNAGGTPAVSWEGLARVAHALRELPEEPLEARQEIAEVLLDAGLRSTAGVFAPRSP